jgi:hypothetical protein
MADLKISQLTGASTPLAGTEVLPIVQSSTTKQVSVANLTAGRAVSAASLALTSSPLPATSGGTGSSAAFVANGIPYASTTTTLTTSSGLTFDGSTLFLGTTTNTGPGRFMMSFAGSSVNGISMLETTDTDGAAYLAFRNSSGVAVGTITRNGASAIAYNTSSDYRLKNTVAPMTGALAKVALLKPCTYKWNADGSAGEGFIAHELAEVCPQAVTGRKDAVDAKGNAVYQGIDTSFLVAILTAAIQEQQAMIATLTARIAALESN